MLQKRITILGSTGSIGENTLDLVRHAPKGQFQVEALTAFNNFDKLAQQAREFNAKLAVIGDPSQYSKLKAALSGTSTEVAAGPKALIEAGSRTADIVMAAIIGAAGLEPTLAAVRQGRTVALANKECLVCAGSLFMEAVETAGATLLPVDSEHNAIFQVLDQKRPEAVKQLILTASGGPFRTLAIDELQSVVPEQALSHPVWDMGAKISIDSATMMNKGLELIEASYLFDRPADDIDVVIHPQSIIHSMVEYVDGSVLAQMGSPDMRTPIAYALAWPDRMAAPVERLDLAAISQLSFFRPDVARFPALRLAREALLAGGMAPNILNAANEVAVAAFLNRQIRFTDIISVVERVLEKLLTGLDKTGTLEAVIAVDGRARSAAKEMLCNL